MEFRTIIDIQFKEFDQTVFEKSLIWLNDPEIKRLTDTPDTNWDIRKRWFDSLKDRSDYYIRSVWRDDEPIGACGLKHITSTDGESFVYIGEKKYWGKAIGLQMLQHVINYGETLGLTSIYAQVLKENINSFKMASRFGFRKERDVDELRILMRCYL
ncbi:MAG: GNAT family N-acetyltransferase [Bacteroidales bacterium]|nr:GNAT family N-acetyltransferase [Bacteroidales bacterium]